MQKIRNLRDVGLGINEILARPLLKTGVLYRSGAPNDVSHKNVLPKVRTIINLRRTQDPSFGHIRPLQVAPRETMNNYVFTAYVFQEWIQRLFNTLYDVAIWPTLLHCTAGKDRTGVVIALILKNIGVPDEAIIKEYMLGEGLHYPQSITTLLSHQPKTKHLNMQASQKRTIKCILLQ